MNSDSAPSLLPEDRPDFERALTQALRSAYGGSDDDPPLTVEQLRAMALSSIEPIAACAAPEYQQYLKHRGQADVHRGTGLTMSLAEQPTSGAGLFAIAAVLTPILAGTAALIFLLLGYLLHAVSTPEPAIATPLRTAGWMSATIAALGFLAGMIGLVSTALRNGSTAAPDAGQGALPLEVAAAREAWLDTLGERGIVPFLAEALAQATNASRVPSDGYHCHDAYDAYDGHDTYTTYGGARGHSADAFRMPRLGYSRPDFSSPATDDEPTNRGPRFSSPRFTGPDFGGPENEAR